MKRWIVAIVLLLVSVAWASWKPFHFPSPAATGQNSNVDIQEMKPTDARYLLNADISTISGMLQPRRQFNSWGENTIGLYSAFEYYNQTFDKKVLLGIRKRAVATVPIAAPFLKTAEAFGVGAINITDSSGLNIVRSNDFLSDLAYATPNATALVYPTRVIRWSQVDENAYIFDGVNSPLLYIHYFDTGQYRHYATDPIESPRILITEAPGQLRARLIDKVGTLDGTFQYRYRYCDTSYDGAHSWISIDSFGKPSLPSEPIRVQGETVVLSGFEGRAFGPVSTTALGYTFALVERMNVKTKYWYVIDTIVYYPSVSFVYVDSGRYGYPKALRVSDTIPTPGTIKDYAVSDTFHCVAGTNHALYNDTFWVAYSYIEGHSGVETPLGPKVRVVHQTVNSTGITCDSTYILLFKGYTNIGERPANMRVYRSVGNDSTAMYGMFQLPVNHPYPTTQGNYAMAFRIGDVSNSELSAGLDSGCCDTMYYGDDLFYDATGSGIVRPPFVTGMGIPLSTVTWYNSRQWGAGDPLYRQRLYYSEVDKPMEWSAVDYLSLGEDQNDEIVYLATINGTSPLFVFKHNSIYALTGYDPEYDLTFSKLSETHGVANGLAAVVISPYVYWYDPDGFVYRMNQSQPEPMSQEVKLVCDSMFPDGIAKRNLARLILFNDKLLLVNDSTGRTLSYDYLRGTWGEISIGNRPILQSLRYDTMSVNRGFIANDDKLLIKNVHRFTVEAQPHSMNDTIGDTSVSSPLSYQTPYVGDGKQQWQMMTVQVTATGTVGSYLKAEIVDDKGVTLATDSLLFSTTSDYRLGFSANVGKYLSLKFTSGATCQDLKIGEVVLYAYPVGTISLH